MDSRLALGIQPLRIPDPAAPMQKALSLNAMLGQNEMQGLQIGQARQALGRQSKLDAIKSQGRDLVTLKDRLMQEGFTNEAIELDRHLRDQQKSQGDLTEQKLKIAAGMAGGFLALDPESRKTNYPTFASEWVANGLPGTPPPQWDESLTNNLMRWASYTLPAQNVQERLDYAALGQPSSMPATTMSDRVAHTDDMSGAMVRSMPVQTEIEGMPLAEGDAAPVDVRLPDENVTAKTPGITPDDYRKEAQRLQNIGTKAAADRAKVYLDEANRMDDRIWKERDQSKPGSIPAGVTWDSSTNQYKMDGRVLTGAEVQAMDLKGRKASANSVMIGDSALGLGKAASTKVDEGLLDTTARKARLGRIEQSYKPEFLEIGNRLSNSWNAVREKAGLGVSAGDKQKLAEFTQWKQGALDNLNQYIKEITGAALSEPEAKRIMGALPNPGQNWYDGDSPTQFKAGLDRAIRDLKAAEARLVYIKRNGLSTQDVPLERMPQIMDQRGQELETVVKQRYPDMGNDEVRKTVRRQLAQEFGLVAD